MGKFSLRLQGQLVLKSDHHFKASWDCLVLRALLGAKGLVDDLSF